MIDKKKLKKNRVRNLFINVYEKLDIVLRHNVIEAVNTTNILKIIINNSVLLFLLYCFFFSFRKFFRFRFLFWFHFFFWFWFFFGLWIFLKVWFFRFYFYFG